MNYLLPDQFRLNFGNYCVYRDVSSNCKDGSCCGALLTCSRSILRTSSISFAGVIALKTLCYSYQKSDVSDSNGQ